MGRHKLEGNKNLKSVKPAKVEVNTEPKKTRGRETGFTVETPIALIYITNEYRIDISDGRNKLVQKFVTKKRANDGKDETEPWKKGDTYTVWENTIRCFQPTYRGAFNEIHDLMLEDGVKEKEMVWVGDFLKLYREKNEWLEKLYKTMFNDEDELKDKKYIKGE